MPYDYPTNATTTTKCHEQVEQEGSIRKIACDAEPLSRPCSYSTRGSTQGSERSPGRPWSRGGCARRSSCSRSPGGHRTHCWVDDRGQRDSVQEPNRRQIGTITHERRTTSEAEGVSLERIGPCEREMAALVVRPEDSTRDDDERPVRPLFGFVTSSPT